MRQFSIAAAAAVLVTTALPAFASSPDAWAAFDREVVQACTVKSGLRNAKPASEQILFPEGRREVALLVGGTYPQKHMKGARGTMLCLYDPDSKTAKIAETEGWQAPPKRR
jgi:hypothetical protein